MCIYISFLQKLSDIRKEMLEFIASTSTKESRNSNIIDEIKSYLDAPNEETECLEWWKEKAGMYLQVAKLAEFCFGIPATSASSEQAFSIAGACITANRSRLSPFTTKKAVICP